MTEEKLVDIDRQGRRLHARWRRNGTPTVVIETGSASSSSEWHDVLDAIGEFTSVIAYDRAGYGDSDADTAPRTADRIVSDAVALLAATDLPKPYVLVGHSLGAHYARRFAQLHRADVCGLVLVDPAHEDQNSFMPQEMLDWWAANADVLPAFDTADAVRLENEAAEHNNAVLRADPGLDDLPLMVVTRDQNGWSEYMPEELAAAVGAGWTAAQTALARLSTNGVLRRANALGHHVHQEDPQAIVDAVRMITAQSHPCANRVPERDPPPGVVDPGIQYM
ncbi:alpha/beta hydrolase [Allokutzneria sp. A3M-2-11 16]|uniref:alpha/beta fold hydrolase n=1 Tax=Allokutzneria sp. A3M-2-11 16 TaxID=2962043 RepID=UPI0020B8434A|nr:alpha/beta hydrolase [Allokutzneria sp. A3M-2-11 16]MCP3802799.1 alpha/beta hydrolase [Allokutzneria sp. A3M-2-11 16]